MPEVAEPPPRTWRPMALWSAGILLALGLAWSVGAVAVPVWQVRAVVFAVCGSIREGGIDSRPCIDRLGGPDAALPKIRLYLRMPEFVAPGKGVAIEMLGGCGRAAVRDLVAMLRSRDAQTRHAAFAALAYMGADAGDAVPTLIDMLSQGDKHDRESAAWTLGCIGPKAAEAVPHIIPLLWDPDPFVAWRVADALIRIGDPRMLDPFLEFLAKRQREEDIFVRERIAGALGDFRDLKVVRPLLRALRSDPPRANRGSLAGPDAWASAQKLFPPELARLALNSGCDGEKLFALSPEQLRGPMAFELLLALLEWRSGVAALLLGASGDARAAEPLLAVLGDKSCDIRADAAYALASLADPRTVGPLTACLADGDKELRAAAACALGAIGPPAVPALERALGDAEESVRSAAAEALKKVRNKEAAE